MTKRLWVLLDIGPDGYPEPIILGYYATGESLRWALTAARREGRQATARLSVARLTLPPLGGWR